MSEKLRTKIRCIGMDKADVITYKAGIPTAVWTVLPLTLRDDQLVISSGDVTETEVLSHENDIAEDYDATGKSRTVSGSFIKATMASFKDLLGGEVVGTGDDTMFLKSGKLNILSQAIRFRLKDGGAIIIPNARGYVDLDINLGATDGMLKCPFKFQSLAQNDFDCDLIIQNKAKVAVSGTSIPLSENMETETKKTK